MGSIVQKCFGAGRFTPEQIKTICEVVASGDPAFLSDLEGAGPVTQLEELMAEWLGMKHVLALSSGTAAIHAALLGLGVGPGDEVIVTSYSWGQSVSPVFLCGAIAVFANIDPRTLFIDAESVRKLITARTKAIIPAHLFGYYNDCKQLVRLAKEHNITLVHDTAHSLGISPGRYCSSTGCREIFCYSLGRGKLISGGEGGLLATNDLDIYRTVLSITQHPARSRREFGSKFINLGTMDMGINYRMHPLAAVLAMEDMKCSVERLAHRRNVWRTFQQVMGNNSAVTLFSQSKQSDWVAYGVALTCENEEIRQDIIRKALKYQLPLRKGPVGEALHLRLSLTSSPIKIVSHFSHQRGSCPVAERRCSSQELWLLSGLEMDELSMAQARRMADSFAKIIH